MKLSTYLLMLEKLLPLTYKRSSSEKKYLLNVGSTNFLPIINIGAALITTPILLRSLGKNDYGIWVLLQSFIHWLSLAQFGFNTTLVRDLAAIRSVPERQERVKAMVSSTFWASAGIAFLLLLITLAITPFFGQIFNTDPQKTWEMILAFYLIFMVFVCNYLNSNITCLFFAHDKYYMKMLIGAGGNITTAILIIALFLSYDCGIAHLAGITLFTALLQFVMTAFLAYRIWNFVPSPKQFDVQIIRNMFRPSLGYFIISLASLVIFKGDNLIIGAFLPLESLAVYAIAYSMVDYAMRFIWNFSDLLSPSLSSCYYSGDKFRLRKLFLKLMLITLCMTSVAAVCLYLIGPWLLKIWVGEDNVVARPILNIFIVTMFSYCITHACGVFINSIGKHNPVTWASSIEAVLNIIISLALLPAYGTLGVALGTLAAHLLTTAWFVPYLAYQNIRKDMHNSPAIY